MKDLVVARMRSGESPHPASWVSLHPGYVALLQSRSAFLTAIQGKRERSKHDAILLVRLQHCREPFWPKSTVMFCLGVERLLPAARRKRRDEGHRLRRKGG